MQMSLTFLLVLLYQSVDATAKAFKAADRMSKMLEANGALKKAN